MMLKIPDTRDTCQKELLTRYEISLRVKQPIKLKGVGRLRTVVTSDMEIKSLEFSLFVFRLSLVQYFLTVLPSFHFGMV